MTHRQRLEQAQQALERGARIAAASKYRQRYHFMPASGWMNDPNGCIWYKGQYHLFYQHNPYSGEWGSMHWGHATSGDLIHWTRHPIVLAPSEAYDDHPKGGVFSGSALDDGGSLKVFYTGTIKRDGLYEQTQCLAVSPDDGHSFEKYSNNPLIKQAPPGNSRDFRDPKVLKYGKFFYMVVGASLGRGAWYGGEGCAHLYRSANLIDWEYRGILARSGGELGSMWECPDLFPLGNKWVLTFSPMFHGMHRSMYMVGDMDFEKAAFTPLRYGDLDYGAEYYATQSLIDGEGRVKQLAWQNGWDWMEGWKDFGPTAVDGWCGCLTLPRVLKLDDQNRIVQAPVPEVESLRGACSRTEHFSVAKEALEIAMPDATCYEMELLVDLERTTAESLTLDLRADDSHRTRLTLHFKDKRLRFDRGKSDGHSSGIFAAPLLLRESVWRLRIFSDTSSVELFCDEGLVSMSNTVYPTHADQRTFLAAVNGSVAIVSCSVWALDGIWPEEGETEAKSEAIF